MARLDTYGANAALTWMERLPVWQGGSVKGLPLFAIGNVPNGAVLLNRVGYLADAASTVDADPGAGNVRWNNATQAAATVVYIADADSAAADHSALWATVTVGGYLYLANVAMTVRQVWQVTAVNDAAGYAKLTVTLVASNASFADNDVLQLSLQQPSTSDAGGTTAGKHAVPIDVGSLRPSTTSGAGAVVQSAGAAGQPDILFMPFDGTTTEYAQFNVWMPKSWNEGTVTFQFVFDHASGFGDVIWGAQGVACGDGDSPAANFGTAQEVTRTSAASGALRYTPETAAITIAGSPAAGDWVRFRIYRKASDALDTLDGIDAQLRALKLFIITDADTDA